MGWGDGRARAALGWAETSREKRLSGWRQQRPPRHCLHPQLPTRPKRSTHPEPRLCKAAPEATEFQFPNVWNPTENKPGRKGSPRASGFLEDAVASPAKVAGPGTPRQRDSHCGGRGVRGTTLPRGRGPGGYRRLQKPKERSRAAARKAFYPTARARDPRPAARAPSQAARCAPRRGAESGGGAGRVGKHLTSGKTLEARAQRGNRKSGPSQ